MLRFLSALAVATLIASIVATSAQQPSLKEILARLDTYLLQYEQTLASVVAEEQYSQSMIVGWQTARPTVTRRRLLVSDYALARAPGGQTWTGFRDTFEVDGKPVRDREARLMALLSTGSPESSAQARRIAADNARYNIGEEVAVRNINVPTVALDLVHPVHRDRFSFSLAGQETIDGVSRWRLAYRERSSPTLIRDPEGKDRRARGSIWLDPLTGEVYQTTLEWEGTPNGSITVSYARDANIGALVPVQMLERYRRGATAMEGEATYSNYRRFQTSGRIIR